ncbi:hypothetical protein [Roseibium aggregatum]|uniref:Uncharacterized protein n=1 Tax=Roseibium aggregatum TaxID=187304 RepID=A0A926P5L6_9HYPH|nr:hypothetical protein [Roseibium aggregatum]MBD1548441.1 hypothetical protein [Roseibium aggregatum]
MDSVDICYSDEDLGALARALRVEPSKVFSRKQRFDAALFWSGLGRTRSQLVPDEDTIKRLKKLKSTLERFLRHAHSLAHRDGEDLPEDFQRIKLPAPSPARYRAGAGSVFQCLGVDPIDAIDGIEDRALANALSEVSDRDEQNLTALVVSLAGFDRDRSGAIHAARDLRRRCTQSIDDLTQIRGVTVKPGHHGNEQVNNWLDNMLCLYEEIIGKPVGMSVAAPGSDHAGEVSGRLIDFLKVAGKPVGLCYSPEAWRSRVRTARECAKQK